MAVLLNISHVLIGVLLECCNNPPKSHHFKQIFLNLTQDTHPRVDQTTSSKVNQIILPFIILIITRFHNQILRTDYSSSSHFDYSSSPRQSFQYLISSSFLGFQRRNIIIFYFIFFPVSLRQLKLIQS